jgi:hypothetical protein
VEVGISLHDGQQQRADARGRQQLQRLHQGRVVTHSVGTGCDDAGPHRFDVLAILQPRQMRQHQGRGALPIACAIRRPHRPVFQHLGRQGVGLVPARMAWLGSAADQALTKPSSAGKEAARPARATIRSRCASGHSTKAARWSLRSNDTPSLPVASWKCCSSGSVSINASAGQTSPSLKGNEPSDTTVPSGRRQSDKVNERSKTSATRNSSPLSPSPSSASSPSSS